MAFEKGSCPAGCCGKVTEMVCGRGGGEEGVAKEEGTGLEGGEREREIVL